MGTILSIFSKPPHNYEAILKNADSLLLLIRRRLLTSYTLNSSMKYWIEGKVNKNCFMLYARDLEISLAIRFEIILRKTLNYFKISFESIFLFTVMQGLSLYEVVFVVKLIDPAQGFCYSGNVKCEGTLRNVKEEEEEHCEM
ncbi:hypothetical protein EUTSA_v10027235mg [Eutrema salsugineum]|uniref:Uncharacterized protein n=1 Tax=Eutrema salsugineum TaxID=72664 RepID=V4LXH5_EUTSA|nr:hypothetical protein EUTSA_v10027235mg [Eutrema salsugineum]